jgi:RNA polymerase sigma factor (sigma-70 family)
VLEKLDSLVGHENPYGWLFRTARNSCHATLRRSERDLRAPRRAGKDDRTAWATETPPRAKTYQDHEDHRREIADEDARDRAEALARIQQLPAGLRAVALLAFEGRSRQEIAETLGITRNAVDQRMLRIRRWYGKEAS